MQRPGRSNEDVEAYTRFLLRQGDLHRVEALLSPYLESGLADLHIEILYVEYLLQDKQLVKAEQKIDQLILKEADVPTLLAMRKNLQHAKGEDDSNSAVAKYLHELTPKRYETLALLIDAYIKDENHATALAVLDKLIADKVNSYNAQLLKGGVYLSTKDKAKAEKAYRKAISFHLGTHTLMLYYNKIF